VPGTADWEPLLVERLAAWLGFEALARRLPGDGPYPPYLFVAAVLFVDFGLGNTVRQVFTGSTLWIVRNPFAAVIPTGLVLAVVGIRYMSEGLQASIQRLAARQRDDVDLDTRPVSFRTTLAVYLLCVVAVFGHTVFVVGLDSLFRIRGVVWTLITSFVIGPLYVSVVVEAVLLYLSIHLLLPRRVADAGLGVHFFDPRRMGGYRPLGELLKRSYYLYTAGLLLYLAWIYGPVVVPYEFTVPAEPGLGAAVVFTVLWLVGIVTVSYSIYTIHRIMAREKEAKIREIES
jgi:hypothetical protein